MQGEKQLRDWYFIICYKWSFGMGGSCCAKNPKFFVQAIQLLKNSNLHRKIHLIFNHKYYETPGVVT